MTDAMRIGTGTDTIADRFRAELAAMVAPDVLEIGTLRWEAEPTHHEAWAPHAAVYVKADREPGIDVDVVADAHNLARTVGHGFDAVIAVSVWEHLTLPWIAAQSVFEVLDPDGYAYISTHHTFPVHGYPNDYTRWTTDGLAALFEFAGFETITVGYGYPCTIVPPPEVTRWNEAAPAFLNVAGIWRKPC